MNKGNGKNYLFVDGTNLYASQYSLFGPKAFLDFTLLIEALEERLQCTFDRIYFYASYSPLPMNPTQKEKLYLKNEAFFYRSVKNTRNVEFFKGYRSPTSGKEKEVDVKLTTDLISFAFLDRFDRAYLLTGDADFLQALFSIRRYHSKKDIRLICMENKIMYKGAHYYPTYILKFQKKLELGIYEKQKIEIVTLEEKKLVTRL